MNTEMLLQVGLTVLGTLLLAMGGFIANELMQLRKSVESLNMTVAGTLPRIDGLEHRVTRIEDSRQTRYEPL